jgi:diadenylate cyclase
MAGLGLLYWIAVSQDLATLEFVLRSTLPYIGFLVIVLFQSEIRQALIYFGNRIRFPFPRRQKGQLGDTIYDEIILACATLSSTKTGALMVLERNVGLKNYIDAGVSLDAKLGYDLLVTIFQPETPLHDGAVIIRNQRVASAACFLPLAQNPRLTRDLGTRHRAAIGITEDTDAIAVVVSEETGIISFVADGVIKRNLDTPSLREMLSEAMNLPVPTKRREPTKTMHETETEISVG